MSFIAFVLGPLFLGQPAMSQADEVTLPNTEVRLLPSEIVDEELKLLIARPYGPPPSNGGYPVIYALDADMSFPLVRQVSLSLSGDFHLPNVIVVGIAYAGGERMGMLRRNRDYTPTEDPRFTKYAARWGAAASAEDASGEAGLFLEFVRDELKPFIEQEYPVDPDDATLFGVSFGGLFATYALLEAPDTFQRYVIGSPSLWWDDRVVFEYEKRYAAEHDDLAARVFIGAGGNETAEHDEEQLAKFPEPMRRSMLEFQEAMQGTVQMVEVIEPFVATLAGRNYPNLDLTLHLFPEETHGSAPPMILSRGLRVVFRE